jgi:hypothetical protein
MFSFCSNAYPRRYAAVCDCVCAEAGAKARARKLVRGLRQALTEDERFQIAHDVVHQLRQHGDPWALSQELPSRTGKAHSTPPMNNP